MEGKTLGGLETVLEAVQVDEGECLRPPGGATLNPTPGKPEALVGEPWPSGLDGNASESLSG